MTNEEFIESISLDGEIWKDVIGFEDYYKISSLGRLCNKLRNKILKPWDDTHGYSRYYLCYEGRRKVVQAHRLTASHFIKNPNNYPCINHKDCNPKNNDILNLEWCTHKYNCNYADHNIKLSNSKKGKPSWNKGKHYTEEQRSHFFNKKGSKSIVQINPDNYTDIKIYPSIEEAHRQTSINSGNIGSCLKGRYSTAGGFIWKYLDEYNSTDTYCIKSLNKAVVRINPKDPNDIKIYKSQADAKNIDGYNQGQISAVCRGERKYHKGFQWMFLSDYENLSAMSKNSESVPKDD